MALFKRKPKRLPPDEWPLPTLVAQQVAVAYMTDAEGDEPRGAVIFHADPDFHPGSYREETVRSHVQKRAARWRRSRSGSVYKMEFVDDDHVGLFMEGDPTTVIRGTWGANSPGRSLTPTLRPG